MDADRRVQSRAATPLPEELEAGVGDAEALAEVILAESDERQTEGAATAGRAVEHRTSAEATPPPG
jgi:hypothetical protein